jgi:DNA processing protein
LRESFPCLAVLPSVTVETISALLGIGELDATVVRDPLAVPELRRKVEAQRDAVLTTLDSHYPPLLREIPDPPIALFVRGDVTLLSTPAIAVVGTRRPTPYGINATRALTRELARTGLTIVSGLARGIDAAAHDETLLLEGKTVAVLGTGLDVTYPREHGRLTERIATAGCIVTEFPPGTTPHAMNFPVRNRIISGLSLGVVVVEAKERSGSLITARLANDQCREVFAVPGPLFSAASAGPHRLIQNGAKLVHGVTDILEEIGLQLAPLQEANKEDEHPLLQQLSFAEGRHIDFLATASGLTTAQLATVLLELELAGEVRTLPGGRYMRVS